MILRGGGDFCVRGCVRRTDRRKGDLQCITGTYGTGEICAFPIDENGEGDAAGRRRRGKINGKQRLADIGRSRPLLVDDNSAVLDDGIRRCLLPVDREHLPCGRDIVLLSLVGNGRIGCRSGKLEYRFQCRNGSVLIRNDITFAENGGECGRGVV